MDTFLRGSPKVFSIVVKQTLITFSPVSLENFYKVKDSMHGVKFKEARQREHLQCFLGGDTSTQRSSRVKEQAKLAMLQGIGGHVDKAWCRDHTALTRFYLNKRLLKGNE